MPVRGENPITSYFPRKTPKSKFETQPGPSKRSRQSDESDFGQESSRKRSKSRKARVDGDVGNQISVSLGDTSLSSQPPTRRPSKTVIEIEDTPPGTPVRPASLHCATPPSSPLPDLTPSPDLRPSSSGRPSSLTFTDDSSDNLADDSCTPSMETSQTEHSWTGFESIPSSQTQEFGTFFCEGVSRSIADHSPNRSIRTYIPSPFQSSDHTPTSSADAARYESFPTPVEFIASSQSQHIGYLSSTTIKPDAELVPSSQTQELFGFEALPSSSGQNTLMDDYSLEKQQRSPSVASQSLPVKGPSGAQSEPNDGLDDDSNDIPPSISKAQLPASKSGPSSPGSLNADLEHYPSSQQSENPWSDEPSSYGSLPAAVKEFQEMFSGTYESYPSEFSGTLH